MQPDDLAKKILERGFLSSQEVIGASGEVAPPVSVPVPAAPARVPRVPWRYLALVAVGGLSVFAGVLLARTGPPKPAPAPPPRVAETPKAEPIIPPLGEPVREAPGLVVDGGMRVITADDLPAAEVRLAANPHDVQALSVRALALSKRATAMPEGPERDKADEKARAAAAECFQTDPARPGCAWVLWTVHEPIRRKLASLGASAREQRVQALATLREATSQTLARNPNDPTCHEVVGAASLELGDALLAAGKKPQALEMWQQAAAIQPSLRPDVEQRMKAAGR